MDTLSILIPAYDCADTLADAVESAVAQRLDADLEVVVVDDGSPDATLALATDLASRHPAVRVERHAENRGGGPARNTAAAAASGDLLYMLDSDNVLPPGCVQAQLDAMRATGAAAVSVAKVQFFDDDSGEPRHAWQLDRHGDRSALRDVLERGEVPAAHGNYLYTRELFDAVGGYEPDLGAMDAWSFGFKQLAHGAEIAFAPGTHYLHRLDRAKSASYWTRDEREGRNDRNALLVVRRHRERLPADVQAKVDALRDDDPFFALIAAGAFRSSADTAEFERALAQARSARSPLGRLRAAVGRIGALRPRRT